jgi:hypothetical protein
VLQDEEPGASLQCVMSFVLHACRSTAVEVGLKMAFKKFAADHGISFQTPAARSLQAPFSTSHFHRTPDIPFALETF